MTWSVCVENHKGSTLRKLHLELIDELEVYRI